jgi:predicted metalloprotease
MEILMKRPKKAIVLRLDSSVLDRIDSVRHPLRMDRTTWLRKAVARNLAYNVEHELPLVAGREIQAALMPQS